MADLNKLVEKIKEDDELKKKFAEAVKENKIEEFCKNLGFDTTKEEIKSFIKSKKELEDSELKDISGGCSVTQILYPVASIVGGGLYCYLYSVVDGNSDGNCMD